MKQQTFGNDIQCTPGTVTLAEASSLTFRDPMVKSLAPSFTSSTAVELSGGQYTAVVARRPPCTLETHTQSQRHPPKSMIVGITCVKNKASTVTTSTTTRSSRAGSACPIRNGTPSRLGTMCPPKETVVSLTGTPLPELPASTLRVRFMLAASVASGSESSMSSVAPQQLRGRVSVLWDATFTLTSAYKHTQSLRAIPGTQVVAVGIACVRTVLRVRSFASSGIGLVRIPPPRGQSVTTLGSDCIPSPAGLPGHGGLPIDPKRIRRPVVSLKLLGAPKLSVLMS